MGLSISGEMQSLQTVQPRWYPLPSAARHAEAPMPAREPRFRFLPEPGDRILRMSKHVALIQRSGAAHDGGFARPRQAQSCALIALHLAPLRLTIGDHAAEIVTSNHLSLHAPGSTYSRKPVDARGEFAECIALSPQFLRRIRAEHGLNANASDAALFAHAFAPCSARSFMALRRLFALARERSGGLDSQTMERMVAGIAIEALRGAQERAAVERKERNARRRSERVQRRQRVEEAKVLLANEFAESSMSGLAARLRCSEGHLSRVFHTLTGYRLVEYRTELRLRRGLVQIERTGSDMADIAAQLGFVSHSHFSSTLRKRFGVTPTEYLRAMA